MSTTSRFVLACFASVVLAQSALAAGECAQFCNDFPDRPTRTGCKRDAAHHTGLCYACGPKALADHPPRCGAGCCQPGQVCTNGACITDCPCWDVTLFQRDIPALTGYCSFSCPGCFNTPPDTTVCGGAFVLYADGHWRSAAVGLDGSCSLLEGMLTTTQTVLASATNLTPTEQFDCEQLIGAASQPPYQAPYLCVNGDESCFTQTSFP